MGYKNRITCVGIQNKMEKSCYWWRDTGSGVRILDWSTHCSIYLRTHNIRSTFYSIFQIPKIPQTLCYVKPYSPAPTVWGHSLLETATEYVLISYNNNNNKHRTCTWTVANPAGWARLDARSAVTTTLE